MAATQSTDLRNAYLVINIYYQVFSSDNQHGRSLLTANTCKRSKNFSVPLSPSQIFLVLKMTKLIKGLPLSVSDSEERCNFVKRFIFRFRNFFVGEDPEECKEDAEGEEGVVLQRRLHRWEPDPHKEVGTPEFEKNRVMGCLRVNFTNILQAAFVPIFCP